MWDAIIAVAGTLLGGIVTGTLQHRHAAAARAEDRAEARRQSVTDAVATVAAALAAHRRAMWVREDARLRGAPEAEVTAARAESHITRAAITAPLTRLAVLAPQLADAAQDAAHTTYALRAAPDAQTLSARRESALTAADHLVATAGRILAAL
ncbi:protein kilB [Streptomyces sp. CA-181903]|uniref:protein kilB n=1 Tax=Streptomyces sp. CA-181903 TaxID=3240055 RepID=UPI003D9501E8